MDTRVAEGWVLAELIHAVWLSVAARRRFIADAILRADHPTGGSRHQKNPAAIGIGPNWFARFLRDIIAVRIDMTRKRPTPDNRLIRPSI
jgi:hypothetical protein